MVLMSTYLTARGAIESIVFDQSLVPGHHSIEPVTLIAPSLSL